MFGRLFRGRSRAPRPDARPAGQPASPYAPLFEEPTLPPAAETAEPPAPPQPPLVATPEPVAEPVAPPPLPVAPAPAPEPPPPRHEEPEAEAVAEQATPAFVAENRTAVAAEPLSADEHAAILGVMRVAPDVRYRAARSAGLLDGLEEMRGAALEHAILERARSAGKLSELAEATSR